MIGATGLVGRQLWPLLEARAELLVLGRRKSGAAEEKLGGMSNGRPCLPGERSMSRFRLSARRARPREAGQHSRRSTVTPSSPLRARHARPERGTSCWCRRPAPMRQPQRLSATEGRGRSSGRRARVRAGRYPAARACCLGSGRSGGRPKRSARRLRPCSSLVLRGPLDRYAPDRRRARLRGRWRRLAGRDEPGRLRPRQPRDQGAGRNVEV